MNNFEQFWTVLDRLDHFGPYWTIMDNFGQFELFWITLDHIGSCGTNLGSLGPFLPFWDKYSGILGKFSGVL